jgi:hypothetical protein
MLDHVAAALEHWNGFSLRSGDAWHDPARDTTSIHPHCCGRWRSRCCVRMYHRPVLASSEGPAMTPQTRMRRTPTARDVRDVVIRLVMPSRRPCAAREVGRVLDRDPDAEPGRGRYGDAY